jgi:predicted amidophosphoribosyltransferase
MRALVSELLGGLADLVLPVACAGCAAERVPLRYGTCADCAAALEALTPFPTAPVPPPSGMPPCTAVGPYAGPLRGLLLAYKERGRHRLARPLGALLAGAVADAAIRAGGGPGVPVVLVPVPSTAKAVRDRHGDHMARLAAHTVRRLEAAGWQASVVQPLAALPRPDSTSLDAAARAEVAAGSLRIRGSAIRIRQRTVSARSTLVVVDDIVTTGATMAAVAGRLGEANMQVAASAVLAATMLRRALAAGLPDLPPGAASRADRHLRRSSNEG